MHLGVGGGGSKIKLRSRAFRVPFKPFPEKKLGWIDPTDQNARPNPFPLSPLVTNGRMTHPIWNARGKKKEKKNSSHILRTPYPPPLPITTLPQSHGKVWKRSFAEGVFFISHFGVKFETDGLWFPGFLVTNLSSGARNIPNLQDSVVHHFPLSRSEPCIKVQYV